MWSRREFLQQSLLAAGVIPLTETLAEAGVKKEKLTKITILHTNDVHSHVEPFPENHKRYPGKGGVQNRYNLINKLRAENPNTLLFDCGDIFQGTPYFNYFGGELEFKLMSMLKYDLATIGNHDFDNSIEGLYKQLPNAKFDFVSANYDFSNTVLDTHVKPYKTFLKDGIKIGVFGIGIKLGGLVDPSMYKETEYLDPIEITQDMTRILKEDEQCDLIICLSHLGYNYRNSSTKMSDLKLAAATKNIDLIIGGHTHTFLPKPTVVKNIEEKNMLVNQVGCYGINLGRVDFYFDNDKNKAANGTSIIV